MAAEDNREEQASLIPLLELAALLDHSPTLSEIFSVPPLGHWLYFRPHAKQSDLRADGHPRGSSLLPFDLPPRRMWAGGQISFLSPIPVGSRIRRRSVVKSVSHKAGRSGPLVFTELQHVLSVENTPALIERQDIVYREAATDPSPSNVEESRAGQADSIREMVLDATALFRFSALTYNAHRIHYDRDYATKVEGYAGLVVQGPFLAVLLIDHLQRCAPDIVVSDFSFRARTPVFAERPLLLCSRRHRSGALLWVESEGGVSFTASVNAPPEAML
jgi:3-methylfumaryl-CoA hydratase